MPEAHGPKSTESGIAAAKRWRSIVAGDSAEERALGFEVVFVCTGNRFRSPLAAALLEHAAAGVPVVVRSAGTLDIGPRRAFPETLEQARRLGVDASRHRASPLASLDVTGADVVIGFEQMHVAVAVMDSSVRRELAYTLPELVQLLESSGGAAPIGTNEPAERARLAIERANATRVALGSKARRPELADPVGGSSAIYRRTADEIDDFVGRLVRELFA
jgi:protein-tyrosine phosphatase